MEVRDPGREWGCPWGCREIWRRWAHIHRRRESVGQAELSGWRGGGSLGNVRPRGPEEEGSRMRTWEAGPWRSRKTEGQGVMETSPKTAAWCACTCACAKNSRGARGAEEGLLEPGQGDSVAAPENRLLGNCAGVPGPLVPPPPTFPSTLESSVELRPFPGRQAGAATWPGLWAWGKRVLGTWLSLELVPPFCSGWGAVGDELRPREAGPGPATSPRSRSEGLPLPPAGLPGWRRAAASPRAHLHFCAG